MATMPFDSAGKHHINPQMARHSSKMTAPKPLSDEEASPDQDKSLENSTTLTDHGDGSFHTESDDEARVDHDSLESAIEHLMAKHSKSDAVESDRI